MKLVQGGDGGGKGEGADGPQNVGEALRLQIEDSGILEFDLGDYVVLFDTGTSMAILSNGRGPGDVLLTLEKGRIAVMAAVYDRGGE